MSGIAKSLLATLAGGASARAIQAGSPVEYKKAEDFSVTKKRGKRGKFGRSFIAYKRLGPFHNQTGQHVIGGKILPIMQTYFKHRILHATKGWRVYIGGAGLRMPLCPQNKSYPSAFFGRNHKFA